jgi:hypothetical protein
MAERVEVVFSDLSTLEPRSGIRRERAREGWCAVDYEAEGLRGTMVQAWGECRVPELTLDPRLRGWYAIHVGTAGAGVETHLTALRLSGDRYAVRFSLSGDRGAIQEALWKHADMTGQSVIVGHPQKGEPCTSCVTHFRFVPLSDAEVAELQKERARTDTKRLLATHDIHGVFYLKNPTGADDFVEELEPYRHSDVGRLLLEYVVDVHDASVPATCTGYLRATVFPRHGDRNIAESLRRFVDGRISFYPEMIAYAREMGIPVSLSTRMNAFVAEPPWDGQFILPFYLENPDVRCRDRDRSEIARASYAFPKVQDAMIGLFKSMLDCGADGVHMLFNRGLPNILYEEPVVEAFRAETGKDAFALGEEDAEWLAFRARYFTEQFMRRVREELDEHARSLGRTKRPFISAHTLADERTNTFFALDVAAWAREGLVDAVVGYPRAMEGPSKLAADHETVDVDWYARAVAGTGTAASIEIMPRQMDPEAYRRRAMDVYARGASGICLWDTYNRVWFPGQWTMASRLGHQRELPSWDSGEGRLYRTLPVTRLMGMRVDKYRPSWGL